MSWGSSILVGVITAVVGAIVAGAVASAAVNWYRIPSFEATSAGFVVIFILLGIVVGLLIGIIASKTIGSGANPSFLRALGTSQAVLLGIAAVVGVSARLLADVPPTLDGETLLLAVEVRWPEGHVTSPKELPGDPSVQLGTLSGNTMRASTVGPLWTQDARLVDGRWVAPGAVDIFTSRGRLSLHVVLDSSNVHAFMLPLSGSPDKDDMKWTNWYPQAKPGAPPLPNGFTYRYRVQRRSEPARVDSIGPFEVQTIASGFIEEKIDEQRAIGTIAEFEITHRGQPVAPEAQSPDSASVDMRLGKADAVSVIGGARPALLAHFVAEDDPTVSACYVITEESEQLRTLYVPECANADGAMLTSDSTRFRDSQRRIPRGRINRIAFETPGLYVVGASVLDTRSMVLHPYSFPERFSITPSVPPLGTSPDGRSFARFGSLYSAGDEPAIVVANFVDNGSYTVPIDRSRMRYATLDAIDLAWFAHHFEWRRGENAADTLVERTGFKPIPYRGRFAVRDDYWLEPARKELRDAIIELLVTEFKGEPVQVESYAYHRPVKIGDQTINVAYGETGDYVSVSMPEDATDRTLLTTITRRLDEVLATGKFDHLFGK